MQTIADQLAMLHSDGVELDLPQLLHYRHASQLLDLTPRQNIQSKLAGTYLAKTKGRGMEFDEVRHYQNGDDVRTIDWRVTARTGKVHTKLYREEKERPVFVLSDLSPNMFLGSKLLLKSVQVAHIASAIGWHAKARGDKFGGIIFNGDKIRELKPASRHTGVLRYLHQLVLMHKTVAEEAQPAEIQLADALGQLRQLCRPGSLIYVLSDFSTLTPLCWRHLQSLRQHNEVQLVQVTDPLDHQLPPSARAALRVRDPMGMVMADLADPMLHQNYAQSRAQQQAALEQQCRSLGLKLLEISADSPLSVQLKQSLVSALGSSHASRP